MVSKFVFEYLDRTGKDLIEHLKLATISQDRANENAAMQFIKLNNEFLTLEQYAKLKPETRDILVGSLFPMKGGHLIETENGDLLFQDPENGNKEIVKIAKRPVKNSVLTQIQAKFEARKKTDPRSYVEALIETIQIIYDVSRKDLESWDFRILVDLVDRVNFFLSECTTVKRSFATDDPFQD